MSKTYFNSFISLRFIKPVDIFVLLRNTDISLIEFAIPKTIFSTFVSKKIGEFEIVFLAVKPKDFSFFWFSQ
jgi:hypothetical protein